MTPDLSRRDALRLGVASVPMLAGCTGSDDGDEEATPHPDDGTDSYGVRVRNDAPEHENPRGESKYGHDVGPDDLTYQVDLKVVYPWSDEDPPWEKTVTVDKGESKEWESVITGEREQVLVGKLPDSETDGYCDDVAAKFWVTPGSESAPDVRYIEVVVDYVYARKSDMDETNPRDVRKDHVMYADHAELTHDWQKPGEDGPFAWNHC